MKKIGRQFYLTDVLEVAPALVGKLIIRCENGDISNYRITETEAYRGGEDLACHASKGRTARTQVMFKDGGLVYVYLIYGMYWMLNIVVGRENEPQAVLIRGCRLENPDGSNILLNGPGKISKSMSLDKSFYGEDLCNSGRIWLADDGYISEIETKPRIGVDYAGEYWRDVPWRFVQKE